MSIEKKDIKLAKENEVTNVVKGINEDVVSLKESINSGDEGMSALVKKWNDDESLVHQDQLYAMLSKIPSFVAFINSPKNFTNHLAQMTSFLMSKGYFIDVTNGSGKKIWTCTKIISQKTIEQLADKYITKRGGVDISSIKAGFISDASYPGSGRFVYDSCIVNTATTNKVYGAFCPKLSPTQRYNIVLINELASTIGYGVRSTGLSEHYSDVCSMKYSEEYVWYMLFNIISSHRPNVGIGNYKNSFDAFTNSLRKNISSDLFDKRQSIKIGEKASISEVIKALPGEIKTAVQNNINNIAKDFIDSFPDK